jgi:hypothetical protein
LFELALALLFFVLSAVLLAVFSFFVFGDVLYGIKYRWFGLVVIVRPLAVLVC